MLAGQVWAVSILEPGVRGRRLEVTFTPSCSQEFARVQIPPINFSPKNNASFPAGMLFNIYPTQVPSWTSTAQSSTESHMPSWNF